MTTTSTDSATLRFLALGDSYTIGESVEPGERWPVQLASRLRGRGIDVAPPEIIARTGWTTDELSAAIDAKHVASQYDLVSLLIGVNNQYRGRDTGEYRTEFRALLARAVGFARGHASHVVVLSIPDWGVTPFAEGRNAAEIGRAINAFNAINREETARAGAHYVDITPISRRASSDASLVAGDGLHPSAAMYTAWVDLALDEVVGMLKE